MRTGEIRKLRWSHIDRKAMFIRLSKEITKEKRPNGITPHDFRRTMKTNMLSAGVDKAHRDMIVGHSLHGMDAIYLVEDDDALRAAMDKFTKYIDKQLNTANINQTINQKQISK